jgi:hypothetical protein
VSERREQIQERLDQGIPPSEQELRWLLSDHADQERTITLLTDAALDLLHTWIEITNHTPTTARR